MGTVLFHGFHAQFDGFCAEEKIFTELFGDLDENGNYCVAPAAQKFFYPAPFIGDLVDKFQLYAIFLLNYDVNLVCKVLPSKDVRADSGSLQSATAKCEAFGKKDECGMKMHSSDNCITPLLIKEHPDIHGYIAIANNDGAWFKSKFHAHLAESEKNYVNMTTPMIVTDAHGFSAIPEIVLHPYRARGLERRIIHYRAATYNPISYILKNYSLLNFFPLVYFSERDTFSLLDIQDKHVRHKYLNTERDNTNKAMTPIHHRVKMFLDYALSPNGIQIHDMQLYMTIDLTTGFYYAKHKRIRNLRETETQNIKLWLPLDEDSEERPQHEIIPFEYPVHMKKRLHGLLASLSKRPALEEDFSRVLSSMKSSYNRVYMFDKGTSTMKFKMERAFPRPNRINLRNKTRKIGKSYKHTHKYTLRKH